MMKRNNKGSVYLSNWRMLGLPNHPVGIKKKFKLFTQCNLTQKAKTARQSALGPSSSDLKLKARNYPQDELLQFMRIVSR
jgi:hypothetical protein